MRVRISTFTLLLILTACSTSAKSIDPETAQTRLNAAWRQPQHTIWEIEGPTMPLGGTLTMESWQAGERFRFEILEAPAPALVGEMLIVDGAAAWQYNRFSDATPAPTTTRPWLSPLSDLVAMIEQRLQQPPLNATERPRPLSSGPAQEIALQFAGGDSLTMTLDEASGLPVRVRLAIGPATFTLTARTFGPLTDPPAGLFRPTP